jgi:RNA polymerase sigma-70 factor (ECF subfamily)
MARPTDPAAAAHDRILVSRMGDGEERALGELYDRHGGVAYAVAYRVLGLRAGAEEVVMEVLAQAWREASRFDPARGSVASWLVTMARSRALDAARSSPRRTRPTPPASAPAAASHGEVAASERSLVVREAVAQLTPAQREAIELAFYGGLTQSEIAERLQAPPGTVKARLRLGMQKLREALAPWLEERTT